MMATKKKYYTIMFIPEGNAHTFSMHIHRNIVYSLALFLLIFLVGLVLLVVKSGEIAAKLQMVYILSSENKHLREENKRMTFVEDNLDRMTRLGRYLQRIAQTSGTDQKMAGVSTSSSRGLREERLVRDSMDEILDSARASSSGDTGEEHRRGTATEMYLAALPNIQPVIDGWITRRYLAVANDTEQVHNGVDYAATLGTPIRATAPGIVEDVSNDKYFGLVVTVKHGFGMSTRYGHCSQILVSQGDHVDRGQTIALVGNTGRSSAPHLHYEVLKDGKNVNPANYTFSNEEK